MESAVTRDQHFSPGRWRCGIPPGKFHCRSGSTRRAEGYGVIRQGMQGSRCGPICAVLHPMTDPSIVSRRPHYANSIERPGANLLGLVPHPVAHLPHVSGRLFSVFGTSRVSARFFILFKRTGGLMPRFSGHRRLVVRPCDWPAPRKT